MALEEMFPNDPHFVAKRVTLLRSVQNTGELETEASSALEQIGTTVAQELKKWCDPLRPDEPMPYAWISKKARDGIQAALQQTLFAAMNKELGLPEDYCP